MSKSLRLQGVNVSHMGVYKWIRKYVRLMQNYLEKIQPNVSDTWRADELWIKVKGNMKYLFALMDDETRFWIAQEIADSKYMNDAQSLFHKGKKLTNKKTAKIITDGLPSYHDAFNKEFYTNSKSRSEHVNTIRLSGDMNNNKMERFNGKVRDREKVMRGLKRKDTPILTGYEIFHNYLRPHMGLNGITLAKKSGIIIEGNDKWKTIIENSSIEKIQ